MTYAKLFDASAIRGPAASIHFSLPHKPPTPYVYAHATDTYVTHLPHPSLRNPTDFSLIRLLQTPLSRAIHRPPKGAVMDTGCRQIMTPNKRWKLPILHIW
jgi:hypothetical protein